MSRELASRLLDARTYLGLSRAFVATESGVTEAALDHIEAGRRTPDELQLRRLSRTYGYPVSYFLGEEPQLPDEAVQVLARLTGALQPEDRAEAERFAAYLHYAGGADA